MSKIGGFVHLKILKKPSDFVFLRILAQAKSPHQKMFFEAMKQSIDQRSKILQPHRPVG